MASLGDKASAEGGTFLKRLEEDADVQLQLDDAVLPGHWQVLSMWSDVLREAVKLAFLSPESSSGKGHMILLPGTRSKDWLKVAAFMYPNEPHVVSWDNLEALLELGDKYEMPQVLGAVSSFICSQAQAEKGPCQDSGRAWKSLQLADQFGKLVKLALAGSLRTTGGAARQRT